MVDPFLAQYKKLEQKCNKLEKCFLDIMSTEKKIKEKIDSSKSDPSVINKLHKIQQQYFPSGFNQIKKSFMQDVQKLNMTLRQLETKMKQISENIKK